MKKLTIISFILLMLGGMFYLCFRPPNILLFVWLGSIGFDYSFLQNMNIKLPLLVSNHFPNVLFIIFGSIVIYIIWNKNRFYYILYISIFVAINIIYEIITQDIGDIIAVIIVYIIVLFVYNRSIGGKLEK